MSNIMKLADKPINVVQDDEFNDYGMSYREYLVAQIASGLSAIYDKPTKTKEAKYAIELADEIIKQLEEK